MRLPHPLQKICCIKSSEHRGEILLAATGPYICSFDILQGTFLSKWPSDSNEEYDYSGDDLNGSGADSKNENRPAKRQKLSDTRESSDDSINIVAERAKGQRRRKKIIDEKLPNVSHLLVTSDHKHAISVTTEDKCIRVFEVRSHGRLQMCSERRIAKRLCAITLTPDQKNIIAGDKFGDIYSLPLFQSPEWSDKIPTSSMPATIFTPSATELTVHTKGNLEALRQQREQQATAKPKKEGPKFEHKLLLGHVSLLTDVVVATLQVNGKPREFILSADRDEHIRVSRGIPQTHIIERYCFGHKEFISKLCILPWSPSTVVVGSGEASLKVYQWLEGKLLADIPFSIETMQEIVNVQRDRSVEQAFEKLAVSGIWTVPYNYKLPNGGVVASGLVLVSLEGLPLLISYTSTTKGILSYHQTQKLSSNLLDVTLVSVTDTESPTVLVSMDTVHQAGSCSTYMLCQSSLATENIQPFVQSFRLIQTPLSDSSASSFRPPSLQWTTSPLSEPLNSTLYTKPSILPGVDVESNTAVNPSIATPNTTPLSPTRRHATPTRTSASPKLVPATRQRNTRSARGVGPSLGFSPNPDPAPEATSPATTATITIAASSLPAYSPLGEFFYGLENLRKKRGKDLMDWNGDDGEDAAGQDD